MINRDQYRIITNKEIARLKEFQDSFLRDKDAFYEYYNSSIKHATQYDDDLSLGHRQATYREGYEMGLIKAFELMEEKRKPD